MTGFCAAFRGGLIACAIGAPVLAALLFAAAPADAGLLRNAPGVGPVALAHRSLNKNLVGGLSGALDRAFRGAVSDDSGEVDAAFDDAMHAVGKTARDMIPGAWLFDSMGKRLKTAAENVRRFFGDARAALDPFGQAEAEVLDGGPLARPEIRPPSEDGGDDWDESMNEWAGATPRSGGGSERQAENDVSAGGGDAWAEVMNERAGAAAPTGGGGAGRSAGGGDAWAEVMNERAGTAASTGGGDAGRSAGRDAWAEVMNERAGAATPTGGGSDQPMESDVRAGNGAREEVGNEGAEADRSTGSAGRSDRETAPLAQRAEERRAPPPLDVDPPSGSYSCEEVEPLMEKAIKEARDRGTSGSMVTNYCALANVYRATIWGSLQCLNDPNLGSGVGASAADRAGARRALQENISKLRQALAQALDGVRTLSDGDGACECWSRICAD